ncbi:hypothetical protein [Nonomuraea soli]|uniref:Uncharacterized protein n=1 Tax=Nonomuraea soli TaxID=1032476 RepID=A0A7W0HSR4_9ACTN|nr:hypothetical protein [Nonomuraea soli]MBA2894202.1 hypothetical protein [Nonomuraea soli]
MTSYGVTQRGDAPQVAFYAVAFYAVAFCAVASGAVASGEARTAR